MDTPDLERLLSSFSSEHTAEGLAKIAQGLLSSKQVNKARPDSRFEQGLRNCISVLTSDRADAERLKALAIAYRLGSTSKPVMTTVRELASQALKKQIPPLNSLADGEDRYYASLALLDAKGDWVTDFVAQSVAREETAETARTTLAKRLLADLPVSDALTLVAQHLGALSFGTEKPAESAARRLRRIIAALRPQLVSEAIPPGSNLGPALKTLFIGVFATTGRPPEGPVTEDLAQECCALVHDVLRTQLTVITDPAIYQSLYPVRDWITPGMWPRFVRKNDSAGRVLSALEASIILLAKQKVTDQVLLDTLQMFVGSREDAERRAAGLARQHPELAEDVREWLIRLGRVRTRPVLMSMVESREISTDPALASLLIHATSSDAENPALAGTVLSRLSVEIENIAARRSMSLKYVPGEIIEYSERSHELIGGHRLGIRRVRVIQPMVERLGTDGIAAVVRKALVEPITEAAGGQ